MSEEYKKNYNEWNERKKLVEQRDSPGDFFFLEGEVWWATLGVNIGQEIDGKNESYERPVLILKKWSDELTWVIPSSSTEKINEYFCPVAYKDKSRNLLLLQMKTVSSKRLLRPIFRMKEKEFAKIKEKICDIILSIKEIPSD